MYKEQQEEQKKDLDKAMLLITDKNDKIKELMDEYKKFKQQVEDGGYKSSKKKDANKDG